MAASDKQFYEPDDASRSGQYRALFERAEDHFDIAMARLTGILDQDVPSILEVGAGSCAMGLLFSRYLSARKTVFSDISLPRIEASYEEASKHFQYRAAGAEFIELDMNEPFRLPDASFDLVVFNAALHHARNIWSCIGESYRVLRPGGHLIALREQICAPLRRRRTYRALLRTREVQSGVSENSYLVEQYLYYLRAGGFRATAIPVVYGNQRLLKRLLPFANGVLFSCYVLLGSK